MSDPGSDAVKPTQIAILTERMDKLIETTKDLVGRVGNLERPQPKDTKGFVVACCAVGALFLTVAAIIVNSLLGPLRDRQVRNEDSLTQERRDFSTQIDSIQKKLDLDFTNYKDRQAQENRWFFDSIKVRQEAWQWALEKVWTRNFPTQPLTIPVNESPKP